jgi:hypothetical protein
MSKPLVKWTKAADVGKSPPDENKGQPDKGGGIAKGRSKAEALYRKKVVTRGMPTHGV